MFRMEKPSDMISISNICVGNHFLDFLSPMTDAKMARLVELTRVRQARILGNMLTTFLDLRKNSGYKPSLVEIVESSEILGEGK